MDLFKSFTELLKSAPIELSVVSIKKTDCHILKTMTVPGFFTAKQRSVLKHVNKETGGALYVKAEEIFMEAGPKFHALAQDPRFLFDASAEEDVTDDEKLGGARFMLPRRRRDFVAGLSEQEKKIIKAAFAA